MSQIDFAVAFVVIFMMVSYSVFFVSNTITKDFDHFAVSEVEESYNSLSGQLFSVADDKSLVSYFNRAQVLLEEVGGYQHTENIRISIPVIVRVYNLTMGEMPSSYDGNVSFDLDFSANEKKYVYLVYDGSADQMTFYSAENVTGRILFENSVKVLSQEKCSLLKSLSYDESKNIFGLSNNFRIDDYCIYGELPPSDANVVVGKSPMLVEDQDGKLYLGYVTLKVW